MTTLRKLAACTMLGSSLLLLPAAFAQKNLQPNSATAPTPGPQNWNKDQLLTSTVHQAWLLSGKNEATFFEMVQQLAELSATNRGIDLPNDEAAGRRFGNYVKTTAKADTDQLLYAVVDKAVVMTSKATIHKAGQPR